MFAVVLLAGRTAMGVIAGRGGCSGEGESWWGRGGGSLREAELWGGRCLYVCS